MSTRALSRRFREQTGTTPHRRLHRSRVRRAQYLLETTGRSIEQIGDEAGFGSATAFREVFQRTLATSPRAYRRAFQSRIPAAPATWNLLHIRTDPVLASSSSRSRAQASVGRNTLTTTMHTATTCPAIVSTRTRSA